MCILSLVKSNGRLIITSNRDEQRSRKNSQIPEIINSGNRKSILARDAQAHGTWLLTDNFGRTAVLLNGAFTSHTPTPPYRESRGIILLNLFQEEQFKSAFLFYNLDNIEPFQVVYVAPDYALQCVWDGEQKHVFQIDLSKPQVYFSPTLYEHSQQEVKRKNFLSTFEKIDSITKAELFDFHTANKEENSDLNFFMNREFQSTKSVTQIELYQTQTNYLQWQAWDMQRHEITLPHATV
ncbi:MAG: hypothetical protein RI989_465 [Bacteroidota bacterium]